MDVRKTETALARFTLAVLFLYVPLETFASWSEGLLNPFYLVDVIAMLLLLAGALHSLRARPGSAPGILCAAYAWTSANGWRATFDRVFELREGGQLAFGVLELQIVGVATLGALACLALSLWLVARTDRR
jgi:hypothetical protein